jgi:hypothetical protein
MLFAFVVPLLVQAILPVPVAIAFADDAALRNRPILVQSYQDTQACANIRTVGAERQCDVMIVRPNMLRMWAVNPDGTYGQSSNFIEILASGDGAPGVFRVTFAGPMEQSR